MRSGGGLGGGMNGTSSNFSSKALQIAANLHKLCASGTIISQQHAKEVQECLAGLCVLARKSSTKSTILKSAMESLFNVFDLYADYDVAIQSACDLVWSLAYHDQDVQGLFAQSGICGQVLNATKRNLNDANILKSAYGALSSLCRHPTNQDIARDHGAIDIFLNTLERDGFHDGTLLQYALDASASVCHAHKDNGNRFIMSDGVKLVIKALSAHPGQASIVRSACIVLVVIRDRTGGSHSILKANAIPSLVKAIRLHHQIPDLEHILCALLGQLIRESPKKVAPLVVENEGIQATLTCLASNPTHYFIVEAVCMILGGCCSAYNRRDEMEDERQREQIERLPGVLNESSWVGLMKVLNEPVSSFNKPAVILSCLKALNQMCRVLNQGALVKVLEGGIFQRVLILPDELDQSLLPQYMCSLEHFLTNQTMDAFVSVVDSWVGAYLSALNSPISSNLSCFRTVKMLDHNSEALLIWNNNNRKVLSFTEMSQIVRGGSLKRLSQLDRVRKEGKHKKDMKVCQQIRAIYSMVTGYLLHREDRVVKDSAVVVVEKDSSWTEIITIALNWLREMRAMAEFSDTQSALFAMVSLLRFIVSTLYKERQLTLRSMASNGGVTLILQLQKEIKGLNFTRVDDMELLRASVLDGTTTILKLIGAGTAPAMPKRPSEAALKLGFNEESRKIKRQLLLAATQEEDDTQTHVEVDETVRLEEEAEAEEEEEENNDDNNQDHGERKLQENDDEEILERKEDDDDDVVVEDDDDISNGDDSDADESEDESIVASTLDQNSSIEEMDSTAKQKRRANEIEQALKNAELDDDDDDEDDDDEHEQKSSLDLDVEEVVKSDSNADNFKKMSFKRTIRHVAPNAKAKFVVEMPELIHDLGIEDVEPYIPISKRLDPNSAMALARLTEYQQRRLVYDWRMACGEGEGRAKSSVMPAIPYSLNSTVPLQSLKDGQSFLFEDVQQIDSATGEHFLQFESRFESGNLLQAIRVSPREYDLVVRSDLHTRSHHQWFYFAVSNTHPKGYQGPIEYKFNIVNMTKPSSMFSDGMKPALYSMNKAKSDGTGWRRCGSNVAYFGNSYPTPPGSKKSGSGHYYTLTFTLTFETPEDNYLVAMCYPYTYTKLQKFLETECTDKSIVRKTLLCNTLGGLRCDVLTITDFENSSRDLAVRPAVVFTGRVHPGEVNASFMMEGTIRFLLGNSALARTLRSLYVFKIVPMLNPDGVYHGNSRTNLAACDLNRTWISPEPHAFPTIWHTKQLIKQLLASRKVSLYVDFHGHSRKKNIFMYGVEYKKSSYSGDQSQNPVRQFPRFVAESDATSSIFSYSDCTFTVSKSHATAARVVVARELGIRASFTLEASFCGAGPGTIDTKLQQCHFNAKHYQQMGSGLSDALLRLYHPKLSQSLKSACANYMQDSISDKTLIKLLQSEGISFSATEEESSSSSSTVKSKKKSKRKASSNNLLAAAAAIEQQQQQQEQQQVLKSPLPTGSKNDNLLGKSKGISLASIDNCSADFSLAKLNMKNRKSRPTTSGDAPIALKDFSSTKAMFWGMSNGKARSNNNNNNNDGVEDQSSPSKTITKKKKRSANKDMNATMLRQFSASLLDDFRAKTANHTQRESAKKFSDSLRNSNSSNALFGGKKTGSTLKATKKKQLPNVKKFQY